MKIVALKVPSHQQYVHFALDGADGKNFHDQIKQMIRASEVPSVSSVSDERRFTNHSVNFLKIWITEQDSKGRCTVCPKQVAEDGETCSIWRPISPDGYISVGDIARVGIYPPTVATVYRNIDGLFASPVGYDLVWRNCLDYYVASRAPEGFVSVGCVVVAYFTEHNPILHTMSKVNLIISLLCDNRNRSQIGLQ